MSITLYQFAECHECGMVRRLLRGKGIPFQAVTLPVGDKTIVRQKFKVESVPVLVDGTYVSSDLTDICRHVAAL
ncbi:MAG: glutathione S-transferase N-terminal domain-containing protein [Candidatus Thermoplasmatota archaeon]